MKSITRKLCVHVCALVIGYGALGATEITSGSQFAAAVAEDPAGSYVLKNDIDLTDSGFATIDTFSGSIDGKGHKITGLGAKTFITTFRGSLTDIVFDGTVSDANTVYTSSDHGVLCDFSYGGKFTGVVVKGFTIRHSAAEKGLPIALFAAYAYDGTEFTRCETAPDNIVSGNSKMANYVAGFVGRVKVTTPSGIIVSFVSCTNNATISAHGAYNASYGSAGFVGMTDQSGSASIPDLQFLHCVNKGNVSGAGNMNLGGFVGRMAANGSGSQSFRCLMVNCVNEGAITTTATSYSTGGFVGLVAKCGAAVLRNCRNLGAIGLSDKISFAGGLVGGNYGDDSCSSVVPQDFQNCANYGSVSGKVVGGVLGGCSLAGWFGRGYYVFKNCANYGALDGTTVAAEIIGQQTGGNAKTTLDIDNCWIASGTAYGTCAYLTSATNIHVGDTDVSGLNSVATATDGYAPWVLGSSAKPELSMFTSETPATEVPVVFANWDGTILKKEFVAKGGDATPPPNPTREGFSFSGWSGTYTGVQQNTTVYAQFGANNFTITFDSDGGSACDPIVAPMGSAVSLPTPVRDGYTFVCWTENGALREPATMPDYDLKLKALWKFNGVPKVTRLKLLQWTIFGTNTAAKTFKDFLEEKQPDFVAVATNPILTFPLGYDSVVRQTNSDNDGPRLYIAWQTNRFEKIASENVGAGSDNQEIYLVVRERGTDNFFAILDYRFSWNWTTVAGHSGAVASILANIRAKYPTATILVAGEHFVAPESSDYLSVCDGTWQGLLSYLNGRYGTRTVAGGDEFEFLLEKTAYPKMPMDVRAAMVLTNPEISVRSGRLTNFAIGNIQGLAIFFR